jgi:NADH dehydrogenase/NADH:ubiquinone oxidoreductase subunit G
LEISINGKLYAAAAGEKILEVARRNKILIPTLCHSEALPGSASCRLCVVELHKEGEVQFVAACSHPVSEGMVVQTESQALSANRRRLLQLYQLMAPDSSRIKNLLAVYQGEPLTRLTADTDNKCILCGLCVRACDQLGTSAISTVFRGTHKKIDTAFAQPPVACIGCGACYNVCPVDAIAMEDQLGQRRIWQKSFELVRCASCGEYYTTREAQAFLRHKLGDHGVDLELCDCCKARRTAEKYRDGLHLLEIYNIPQG